MDAIALFCTGDASVEFRLEIFPPLSVREADHTPTSVVPVETVARNVNSPSLVKLQFVDVNVTQFEPPLEFSFIVQRVELGCSLQAPVAEICGPCLVDLDTWLIGMAMEVLTDRAMGEGP